MTHAVVTGSSGFIGRHLINRLNADGVITLGYRRSFDVNEILGFQPDIIYHCAGIVANRDDAGTFAAQLDLNTNQLHALIRAADNCEAKLILPSTVAVHGRFTPYNEKAGIDPQDFYALTKSLAEQLVLFHGHCVVRLPIVYGPSQRPHMLIPWVIQKFLSNEPVEIAGGHQTRNLLYIDDVVDLLMKVVGSNFVGVLDVGDRDSITIEYLIRLLQELTNTGSQITWGPMRPNEIERYEVDATLAYSLGWSPQTSLLYGLARTINDARNRLDKGN